MQGRILRFSVRDGGIISGDDGQRYSFEGSAWTETGTPAAGQRVDFDAQNGQALDIVLVPSTTATGSKSKIVAFLLAFLAGRVRSPQVLPWTCGVGYTLHRPHPHPHRHPVHRPGGTY